MNPISRMFVMLRQIALITAGPTNRRLDAPAGGFTRKEVELRLNLEYPESRGEREAIGRFRVHLLCTRTLLDRTLMSAHGSI